MNDLDPEFRNYFFEIVNQARNGITVCDPNQEDSPVIYVNQEFTNIFEYPAKEVIGKNLRFLQNDDTEQINLEKIREAIKNQAPVTTILRNYTKSGKLIYNEVKISPIFDEKTNKLKYFLGVQKDISDCLAYFRYQNDDAIFNKIVKKETFTKTDFNLVVQELSIYQTELLAQNEELMLRDKRLESLNKEFSTLFQNAPLPFLLVDKNLQIIRYNKRADSYFKFSLMKLQIKSLFNFIKAQNIQKFLRWINDECYIDKNIEIDIFCNDTNLKRFKIEAKKYSLDENLIMLTLVDIQEEYEIKQDLEKKVQEELQKVIEQEKIIQNQAKLASMGEMIDAIAHQWKQPLGIISLKTDFLVTMNDNVDSIPKNQVIKCKDEIRLQIDHLLSTLKQFRNFLRPNNALERFNLVDMIKSVLVLIKDEFIKNEITINFITQNDNITIEAIENEFKHVLLNILNNAKDVFVERNTPKRTIDIELLEQEEGVLIKVYDNAGGISKYILDNIFQKHVSGKSEGSSTGIGLYMSKQIIDKMGAKIDACNFAKGALFEIEIPCNLNKIEDE